MATLVSLLAVLHWTGLSRRNKYNCTERGKQSAR